MNTLFSMVGFGVCALLLVTYCYTRICSFEKRISKLEGKEE